MNLQQMRYVLCTAQHYSISKAARALYITQPNLSNAIKELEKELGIRLFERNKNGVSLTSEGAEFINSIQPIVKQIDLMEEKYKMKEKYEHRLCIASQHSSVGGEALCMLLEELGDDSFQVDFLEVRTRKVLEYVQHGICELGLLLKTSNNKVLEWEFEKRRLDYLSLKYLKPHVFLHESHPLANREMISEEDLIPYPYVRYSQGMDSNRFFSEDIIENTRAQKVINVTDKMSNRYFNRNLKAYTLGSGILSDTFGPKTGVAIPYNSKEVIEFGVVVSKDRTPSALANRYIEILKEKLNGLNK